MTGDEMIRALFAKRPKPEPGQQYAPAKREPRTVPEDQRCGRKRYDGKPCRSPILVHGWPSSVAPKPHTCGYHVTPEEQAPRDAEQARTAAIPRKIYHLSGDSPNPVTEPSWEHNALNGIGL